MNLIVTRTLPLLAVALLIACGGGDKSTSGSRSIDKEASATLQRSQEKMSTITALHTSVKQTITQNGKTQTSTQEMDQEGANRAFGKVTGPGIASFEMAIDLPNVYIRLPGRGWQSPKEALGVSFEELGFDLSAASKSEFQYVNTATKVEPLTDVVVGGEPMYQIKVSGTAEALFKGFAAAIGGKGPVPDVAKTVRGGTVEATYLIDREYRLRKTTVTMEYKIQGISVSGLSEGTFSSFGVPVKFPADLPR